MDYKSTINLPKTSFSMKANLPQKEPETLKYWEEMKIYESMQEIRKGKKQYILHDGPPYANGNTHIGTALNKVLKDIIVKYMTMSGYDSPYIPGWDCHGMPIEHNVVQEMGKEVGRNKIRENCIKYAEKYVPIQRDEFKRLGVFGDWERPYLTMNPEYEINVLKTFKTLVEKGYIYRAKRPIHWCPGCKTALAEAELEYKDHLSPSIYVKFPVKRDSSPMAQNDTCPDASFLIWTTTPWTLPANVAVALHPDYDYSFIKTEQGILIVADELMEKIHTKNREIMKRVKGKELEGAKLVHPLVDRISTVILADFVKKDEGTGCVHIAPGHGEEDYQIGLKYNLPIISPVDDGGVFTEEAGIFKGKQVFEANDEIIEVLEEKGLLVDKDEITHSYPHCWRCDSPLIFRATPQWFLNVNHKDLKNRMLEEIERVKWIPSWSKERIYNTVKERPDWCLSRQRVWGIPIPVLYCKNCEEPVLNSAVVEEAILETENRKPKTENRKCKKCGGEEFIKEKDIFDVWFDSSSSYNAVARVNFPADLYLEGVDHHRVWFQHSLLLSMATDNRSPFKACLTHGLVLDEKMHKMSKKLGNIVSPMEITDKFGADILRLYFSSVDYTRDIPFNFESLESIKIAYRKIRNTFKFLLGNIYDYKEPIPYNNLLEIDKLMLHKLQKLIKEIRDAYKKFEFYKVYHLFYNYCIIDLSKFYLDILKDRLYTYGKESNERRSAQTVLYETLSSLARLIAPVLPFTAEEVWKEEETMGMRMDRKSIFVEDIPEVNENYIDEDIEERWQILKKVRDDVLCAIEDKREQGVVGNSLEAKVILWTEDKELREVLGNHRDELSSLFIVSQVEIRKEVSPQDEGMISYKNVSTKIERAKGKKCERCWIYSEEVGKDKDYPTLCPKCIFVLKGGDYEQKEA